MGKMFQIIGNKFWILDLPVKLMAKELEPFTTFMLRELRAREIKLEEEPYEKGMLKKIRFIYDVPESGWTENEIIIQPKGKEYDLKLICSTRGSSSQSIEAIRLTATHVRKLLLEWSAASCDIVASFDSYLSQIYNLIDVYNPTTMYLVSTYADTHERIEKFRETLISMDIRPPKFVILHVDPLDLKQTMKNIKDLVSRADIVCVSGENATLCTALAMEAVKQNKIICYVIDDRPVVERIKDPFKSLKIVSFTSSQQ